MISRRQFMTGTSGIVFLFTPGCLPLLAFRLVLGRAMVGALTRGAMAGRAPAAASVGRGMAIASRAHRVTAFGRNSRSLRSLPNLRLDVDIINDVGREVAHIVSNENMLTCLSPARSVLMRTATVEEFVAEHYDVSGDACGYTEYDDRKSLHNHFDVSENFIGCDRIIGQEVEHYDYGGRRFGTSRVSNDDSTTLRVVVSTDAASDLDASIRNLERLVPPRERQQLEDRLEGADLCRLDPQHQRCEKMQTLDELRRPR